MCKIPLAVRRAKTSKLLYYDLEIELNVDAKETLEATNEIKCCQIMA